MSDKLLFGRRNSLSTRKSSLPVLTAGGGEGGEGGGGRRVRGDTVETGKRAVSEVGHNERGAGGGADGARGSDRDYSEERRAL